MTEGVPSAYQIRTELDQAISGLEISRMELISELEKQEEKQVSELKAKYQDLKREAVTWFQESVDYLRELSRFISSETPGRDHLCERMKLSVSELRITLARCCKLTLPDPSQLQISNLSLSALPLKAKLDQELPLNSLWGQKLFVLDPTTQSIRIISLVRMEVETLPLKGKTLLNPSCNWTITSTGHIFACGGGQFGMASPDCFLIDLKTLEVTPTAPMTIPRTDSGVIELNGSVYVFGGEAGLWEDEKLPSCEVYSLDTGKWRMTKEMGLPKGYLCPCIYKGRIMLASGEVNQIEAFNPSEESFQSFYAGYLDRVLMAASFADETRFYTLRRDKVYAYEFSSDFLSLPEVQMIDIPYNIWLTRTQPVRLHDKFFFVVRNELWSFDSTNARVKLELTL